MLATETVVTVDHDEIQRWASHHHAQPVQAFVSGEVSLDFPQTHAETAVERPISWDRWFAAFDRRKLAFVYRSRQADGGVPNFHELVTRAA